MIDPVERCLSYEVLENNVGFRSYVATIKVTTVAVADPGLVLTGVKPLIGGWVRHWTVDGGKVCLLEWSFVSDPVDGWKKEDLESFVDFFLKNWANKMEMNL
ncbi:Polyketide cyclase/dehydrase and lipid transport superfamily protein [Raphanus sativus]|nr:Polyketide cyclase/dehydrase and lipid transport superfamily protein [Raphanus sativus]